MDDEAVVRETAGAILDVLGYTAAYAKDGAEAIDAYIEARAKGEPFDAVIMDLTVPGGMGGKEAIALLLQIDPSVKAIVSRAPNDPSCPIRGPLQGGDPKLTPSPSSARLLKVIEAVAWRHKM